MKSMALETGILHHHKMIMAILGSTFTNINPKSFTIAGIKSSI